MLSPLLSECNPIHLAWHQSDENYTVRQNVAAMKIRKLYSDFLVRGQSKLVRAAEYYLAAECSKPFLGALTSTLKNTILKL